MKLTLIGLQNYKQNYEERGVNNLVIIENTGRITMMFHEKVRQSEAISVE